MKHFKFNLAALKTLTLFCVILFSSINVYSQDTLHLVYHHTQIKPHDSTEAKIDAWIKNLKGKHVDIQVIAYFHKSDFKKFSQERSDELFLVLNRKARAQLTFDYYGAKKGSDEQRTTVDIIYKITLSPEEQAAAKAKADAAEAKAKEEAEAAKKAEKDKKSADDNKKSKSDVAAEQTEKGDSKKTVEKSSKAESTKPQPAKKEKRQVVNGGPGVKPAGKGTFAAQSDVEKIKAARIIVPLTDSPDIDSALIFAVKNFWTVNKNVEYGTMSYIDAKKLAKTEKNTMLFIVTDIKSTSLTHNSSNDYKGNGKSASEQMRYTNDNYRTVSSGASVMLEDGKGKIVLAGYIPSYTSQKLIGTEAVVFGVSQMNSLLDNLEKYNIKNNLTFNKPFKQNAPRLKDKVLLLPDAWVHEKLDINEIPAHYEGKAKVVDYNVWSKAIIEKQNFAYTIVVPYPSGGKYIYLHYLMDASTGDVLFISQPKVAVSVYGNNVSAANTGFINAKNLKNYNDAFHMKVNEEEKEEPETQEGSLKKEDEKKVEKKKAEPKEKPKEKSKEKEKK